MNPTIIRIDTTANTNILLITRNVFTTVSRLTNNDVGRVDQVVLGDELRLPCMNSLHRHREERRGRYAGGGVGAGRGKGPDGACSAQDWDIKLGTSVHVGMLDWRGVSLYQSGRRRVQQYRNGQRIPQNV